MEYNLRSDLEKAIVSYPKLKIKEENGSLELVGEIDLIHSERNLLIETFSVNIFYPKEFPYCFPKVIETGDQIPRSNDRHVNKDTTLCLVIEPEERLLCLHGITTVLFIEKVLLPRLGEEYTVNKGGKYVREYSHGIKGLWEFYFFKFKSNDPKVILQLLESITTQNIPKRSKACPCGSGNVFKKCHINSVIEINRLGRLYLKSNYYILMNNVYEK